MITFFRKFFQSKVGIALTLVFLAIIALAFASMDVANTGMFGGVAGGDRVAVVGDRRISTSDLTENVNSAVRQARGQNPQLTTEQFVEAGGLQDVLDQIINRAAIAEFANRLGLRAGDRLVDSEIMGLPAFQGPGGSFSEDAFRGALRQQGLSESTVREDLRMGLYARQLLIPMSYGATMPDSIARRYAGFINETRVGRAVALPALLFAPDGEPSDDQLTAYYDNNRARYRRPERRTIRYASFGPDAVGDLPAITEQQIANRYRRDAELYAAREQRSFTQLVVPTQAAAQAVIDEVRGGVSLESSAQAKGLATASIEDQERQAYASQASQAVAQAAFEADEGALVGPVRGSLGWYVLRVDDVQQIAGRSLAQVSGEIRESLTAEQRRAALNDLTERLEDELADGRSLSEVARELGVDIENTRPLTAQGQVYGTTESAPDELARVIPSAFEMNEGDPQLAEIVPGQRFLVFDVGDITPSAVAPLAEIRDLAVAQWRRDRGMAAAGEAAARILQRMKNGQTMAQAVAAEDVRIPPPQNLSLDREQLAQQQVLTRADILFFNMAEGSAKRVKLDRTPAWFVVELDEIRPGEPADQQQLAGFAQQLSGAAGNEYIQQFVAAARNGLDVETNQAAIDAVRAQLTNRGQ
ncbi:peptidylprolyl isomerase [Aurantiacibacter spongiae]|uniref:Parvulin-like PPIase n=1 Tax=Aurantiacibacter spongiae TaxID=2488860 RepID=A0A3N5DMV7_9SPHN|nr:peptidylprolyl isomerase [Aurantiacibacter spongiae]RPF70351.1 peptidylprolyl isomerase [Aurantiacibacter spongiae]